MEKDEDRRRIVIGGLIDALEVALEVEIRTRKTKLNSQLREALDRHFAKVEKQVSPLATLHLELRSEQNPAIAEDMVADARLHLKGTVLRAQAASGDMAYSMELVSEKLSRQVKKYNEKRRNHRVLPKDVPG